MLEEAVRELPDLLRRDVLERREEVAFSPVILVTGTKLLVKRASRIDGLRDLKGKTVVVTAGTTNAAAVEALAERQRLGIVRDPDAKAAAAELYAKTSAVSKRRYAPRSGTMYVTGRKRGPKPLPGPVFEPSTRPSNAEQK